MDLRAIASATSVSIISRDSRANRCELQSAPSTTQIDWSNRCAYHQKFNKNSIFVRIRNGSISPLRCQRQYRLQHRIRLGNAEFDYSPADGVIASNARTIREHHFRHPSIPLGSVDTHAHCSLQPAVDQAAHAVPYVGPHRR